MQYEKYIISQGGKEIGLAWSDIRQHLLTPARYDEFTKWMRGQTTGVLGDLGGEYISIVYTGDFIRFINNKPLID